MYDAYYYRPATKDISEMTILWGMFKNKRDAIEETDRRFRDVLNCVAGCKTAKVINSKTGEVVASWDKSTGQVLRKVY